MTTSKPFGRLPRMPSFGWA
uniref:Uncharacterized protein n=1 Tax=Rhizophora mucronata TaxID=61149 RepID=A0A2P2N9M4_RHIMU